LEIRPIENVPLRARLVLAGLGAALAAVVLNGVVSYRYLDAIAENNQLVGRTAEVLTETERVLSLLKDAETGQRGYLLTGEVEYLQPYESAAGRTEASLQNLRRLMVDQPAQQDRLNLIDAKARRLLAELGTAIQLQKDQNAAAALAMVKSGQAKQQMDEIRSLARQMEEEEQGALRSRREDSATSLRRSRRALAVGSLFVVLTFLAAAAGVLKHLQYRRESERRVHNEHQWLTATLGSIGDAVMATDNDGRIAFLNHAAETLTGWSDVAAKGRPLDEVFRIVNERTRQTVESPVAKALRMGLVVGLANHTVLIARDGTERPIDDSAAPIFDESRRVVGVVLVFRDATEQRRAEVTLQKLAAIVEHSEDAVISKTQEGIITSWNAAAERLFGYQAAEAIGKHIDLVIPPDRRDEHAEIMRKLLAGERIVHFDTVRMRKDGSTFDVSLGISPIKNAYGEVIGAAKVLRDVSERKRAEGLIAFLAHAGRALAVLSDRRSALQQAAAITVPFFADWCVVYGIDETGTIQPHASAHRDSDRSRRLAELLGKNPIGGDTSSVVARVLRSGQTELLEDVAESLRPGIVVPDLDPNALQELDPQSLIVVPLVIRGRVTGAISFVLSGARRYRSDDAPFAEEIAGRVAIALDNAHLLNSVKLADRQKDEFLAMLAHELRNPLAAIQYATALAKIEPAEAKEELFDLMQRQIANLAHLIDDLLDVSRINQGKIQLRRELIDAAVPFRRAVASVRPLVEERRHSFAVEIAGEPMPIQADPTRVEQIIANLLTNAAKYTPEGGQIALRAYPKDDTVIITVQDTGVGLPAELLPRVFDLFMQADRTLDRAEGGLGIGLTVVRQLTEMHGGSVAAASEGLGRGSEFTVRLPLDRTSAASAGGRQPSVTPSRTPLKILVVDDNHDTARTSALWLKTFGHDLREAYDGKTALEIAREFRPNVILLDIGLPGMSGYEVAQALRREGFTRETLIAISGYSQPEDRRRSQEAGFDHHLAKPVDFKTLMEILQGVRP
jgi:PAS domain S-box-containing protein